MTRLVLSWDDFAVATNRLIDEVRGHNLYAPPTLVLPVVRGGLVPGTMVAYALGLGVRAVEPAAGWTSACSDLLIVDDICDTGRTFELLKGRFPNAVYACVYAKSEGLKTCHYYGKLVPQDCWVVFPFAPNDIVNR